MLAAFGVMVSHAYPLALGAGTPEPFETFMKGDNLGRASVFAFFAISGFFITKSLVFRQSTASFLAARVLRLFPALIVMVVVVTVTGGLFLTIAPDYWSFVPAYALNVISLQGLVSGAIPYLPGMFTDNPTTGAVNGSLWTLRFEALCYIGVLVAGLLGVFSRRWVFLALAVAFLALFLIFPHISAHYVINTLLYLGLPFVIGAAFFVFRDDLPVSIWVALGLSVLVVALRPTPLFLPMFMLALSYWVFWLGFVNFPTLRSYNALGDYSYGFYIYAFPVQQIAAQMGFTTPLSNILFSLPVTLALAALSWHGVERPMLGLKPARTP